MKTSFASRFGVLGFAAALALGACVTKAPKEERGGAIAAIVASEPNAKARALRDEVVRMVAASQLDAAAERIRALPALVDALLSKMDELHHRKTAVPDFEVVRYVEALRDLGESLRGFERLYSPSNPPSLKKEMLQGLVEQLRSKIR